MEKLVSIITTRPLQFRSTTFKILLLSSPTINEETEYCRTGDKYLGATKKSEELVGPTSDSQPSTVLVLLR